ncbi:hypothetical protein U1Q18_008179 [Sarracenia purpurea var. burkii]
MAGSDLVFSCLALASRFRSGVPLVVFSCLVCSTIVYKILKLVLISGDLVIAPGWISCLVLAPGSDLVCH